MSRPSRGSKIAHQALGFVIAPLKHALAVCDLKSLPCVCVCVLTVQGSGSDAAWGMCVDHIMVRDLDTQACTEFSGNGQWLGARPPALSTTVAKQVGGSLPVKPSTTAAASPLAQASAAGHAPNAQTLRLLPSGCAAFTITAR